VIRCKRYFGGIQAGKQGHYARRHAQGERQTLETERLSLHPPIYAARQVLENTESTKRQYALRQRATALGWHADRIVLIDNDLGHSAALAADPERVGFQRLVSEVGLGRAGLVIGLEGSRLARNSSSRNQQLIATTSSA
jgi:hypothetical protein